MAKGLYLGIGLNAVDPKHYAGWNGRLRACEYDIRDMSEIVSRYGFGVKTLLTKQATRGNVIQDIKKAAKLLSPDDIFIINYSGHGGQLPDINGDEEDHKDETWCLYDKQLVDDELFLLLTTFRSDVRIIVISDSCHSGTMIKEVFKPRAPIIPSNPEQDFNIKAMPLEIELKVLENNSLYKGIKDTLRLLQPITKKKKEVCKHKIMLLSGCQDNQYSQDGLRNGLFTSTLKRIWNNGKFKGSYKEFYTKILRNMPPEQTPNMMLIGDTNNEFLNQEIFTIGIQNGD